MGHGDAELGKKLMTKFLEELLKTDEKIDMIGCVNSGVNLTTEGSNVIETLKEFELRGARIATCGTCLEYHNIKDKLMVGEVGTMAQGVAIMTQADKVIRPN